MLLRSMNIPLAVLLLCLDRQTLLWAPTLMKVYVKLAGITLPCLQKLLEKALNWVGSCAFVSYVMILLPLEELREVWERSLKVSSNGISLKGGQMSGWLCWQWLFRKFCQLFCCDLEFILLFDKLCIRKFAAICVLALWYYFGFYSTTIWKKGNYGMSFGYPRS